MMLTGVQKKNDLVILTEPGDIRISKIYFTLKIPVLYSIKIDWKRLKLWLGVFNLYRVDKYNSLKNKECRNIKNDDFHKKWPIW